MTPYQSPHELDRQARQVDKGRGVAVILISPKRIVFLLLGALTLATIWEHELPLLNPANPEWPHIAPFRGWLVPHILSAAVALIVGPLQFSSSLRRRSLSLHRWMGRVYIGVAFEIPDNRWLMGSMAGLWMFVTACAWITARRRDINQHQLWIMRSHGLTFTFVTTRYIPDKILPGMGYAGVTTLYWVLIVASLILPDLLVNGGAIWRRTADKRS